MLNLQEARGNMTNTNIRKYILIALMLMTLAISLLSLPIQRKYFVVAISGAEIVTWNFELSTSRFNTLLDSKTINEFEKVISQEKGVKFTVISFKEIQP